MDAVDYTPLTHSISSNTNMKIQVGKAQYSETRVSLIPFSGQGHYAKDLCEESVVKNVRFYVRNDRETTAFFRICVFKYKM